MQEIQASKDAAAMREAGLPTYQSKKGLLSILQLSMTEINGMEWILLAFEQSKEMH